MDLEMAGFKPGVPELEATALPSEPSTLDTYIIVGSALLRD